MGTARTTWRDADSLQVECWCRAEIVWVPRADVLACRTLPCRLPRCQTLHAQTIPEVEG